MRELGSLDFDDLLVYGLKLLRQEKHVVSSVRHVLVDEFQVRRHDYGQTMEEADETYCLGHKYNAI